MKTLVLGGGVVGVTTAYFLAKAGHEVTILEEKDALGLEASSGNAGIIAPGHSFAWASPRAPRMLWDSLRGGETAIRIRPTTDLRLYTWGLRFLRECTADRARRNTLIKLRLCQYSQSVMNDLVRAEQIEYHAITKGAPRRARAEAGDPRRARRGPARSGLRAGPGQDRRGDPRRR
jgi:D-amino-acid dehydrogenase